MRDSPAPMQGGGQDFGRLPGKRDASMGSHDVAVALAGEGSHEPKVADLGVLLRGQEDVAGGQVAVEEELGFQVGHPLGHLQAVTPEPVEGEGWAEAVVQRAQRGQLRHLRGGGEGGVQGVPGKDPPAPKESGGLHLLFPLPAWLRRSISPGGLAGRDGALPHIDPPPHFPPTVGIQIGLELHSPLLCFRTTALRGRPGGELVMG